MPKIRNKDYHLISLKKFIILNRNLTTIFKRQILLFKKIIEIKLVENFQISFRFSLLLSSIMVFDRF